MDSEPQASALATLHKANAQAQLAVTGEKAEPETPKERVLAKQSSNISDDSDAPPSGNEIAKRMLKQAIRAIKDNRLRSGDPNQLG